LSNILFFGGTVVTMASGNPEAEAVLVSGNKVSAVGSLSELRQRAGTDVELMDLGGKTLLPGFIDAHSHILWAAKTRGAPVIDVRAQTVPTYQALLAKIKRHVAASIAGEPLLFFGLDPQLHHDLSYPSRDDLDAIAPNNPIGIQTSNLHVLFLNSAGLALCDLDEHTPIPEGSTIDRSDDGRLTGRIGEAITWIALEKFYQVWGDARLNEEFQNSIVNFASQGITTTTEHLYQPFYKPYYQAALNQKLPMPRVAAYQQAVSSDMKVEQFTLGQDRMWMAGIKIHADGSPFVGNVWLSEPYLETPTTLERMNLRPGHTGSINYPPDYFADMVRTYFAQGWQMAVHTQGDRTIDMVLDVLEEALKETPRRDHRFRLEHCGLMREDQIIRAKDLGVQCSFFINHITYWGAPIEDALFGPERAAHYVPSGSAAKSGMKVSLHADTPMTDPSALAMIQAAVTRKADDGRCVGPDQRMEPIDALKAVTIDAAFHIGMEQKLGSIEVGKYADFAILDSNPLIVQPDQLSEIQVSQTWIDGEKVWSHE